jgi:hypothetical protein
MAQDPGGITQLAGTVRVGGTAIDRNVLSSIHAASRKTGVSFAFMLAKARRESNFEPTAENATSSAQGLFQFTKQTWLGQIKAHGAEHGLGALARQIHRGADGRYVVDDPKTAKAILDLREDHVVSSAMAAEYAADNRRVLTHALGRKVGDTDLYFAHFLGPGGAIEFLSALDRDPNQDASALLPKAASANRSIFFGASGEGRTLGEIHAIVERNIDASMRRYAGAGNLPELNGPIPLPPGVKPESIALAAARAARPEAMGVVGGEAVASLPPTPDLKPARAPENMGATRVALANQPPRPLAMKPKPEDMGDFGATPTTPPETMLARAESPPRWSDQTLAFTLAATYPMPNTQDQARAFDAVQAFADINQAGFQWAMAENDSNGDDGLLDGMAPPGLPQAALPARAMPKDAPPIQVATGDTLPRPTATKDKRLAPETVADLETVARAIPAAVTRPTPTATAANGAASYAVLAVVETFDPNQRVTAFSAPIPVLDPPPDPTATREPPVAEPVTAEAKPPDSLPVPPPDALDPTRARTVAALDWFRRMFG